MFADKSEAKLNNRQDRPKDRPVSLITVGCKNRNMATQEAAKGSGPSQIVLSGHA